MKYTVHGFSQSEALKFRRTEIVNGKPRVVAIDCTDLLILRWMVEFWPRMRKVTIDGEQYGWLKYQYFLEDYPLVDIKKRMLALRLKKLVSFGILIHKTVKKDGTYSYYGFGPNYDRLIDDKYHSESVDDGCATDCPPVVNKLTTPGQQIDDQINPSTIYPSTKDEVRKKESSCFTASDSLSERLDVYSVDGNSKEQLNAPNKARKKENNTRKSFNDIIDDFTQDQELRESLRGFVQYRTLSCKNKGTAFTNRSLELSLKRLSKMTYDTKEMVRIVDAAVENGWSKFYGLGDADKKAMQAERNRIYDTV